MCHVGELIFGAVLVALMSEFDLEKDEVTLLGIPGLILFGVGAVPAGLWTDRWSSRGVLVAYFFWLGLAATLVTLVDTPWALAGALTCLGGAISLYHPAGLAMIAHGCQKRGLAMGINGVAGSLGIAVGPALGYFCANQGDWRLAYGLLAGIAFIGGVAAFFIPIDETSRDQAVAPSAGSTVDSFRFDYRSLGLLLLAMTIAGLNYRCLMTALPNFLAEQNGETGIAVSRGDLIFFILALGGIGQILGGYTVDKVNPGRFYVLMIACMILPALCMAHGNETLAVAGAGVLAIFVFAQQPVENTLLAQLTPARMRSTFYGLKFILTFGIGALGAQLVGFIWQHTGELAPVFDVFASGALGMMVVAMIFCYSRQRMTLHRSA